MHAPHTPDHRAKAEERLLAWNGVQTRHKFSIKEEEVVEWLEQVTLQDMKRSGRNIEAQLYDYLEDGTVLCLSINSLVPGSLPDMPRASVDRIDLFIAKCREFGVAEDELFSAWDLLTDKNMVKVTYCLRSLAEIFHNKRVVPFFRGKDRKQKQKDWKISKSWSRLARSTTEEEELEPAHLEPFPVPETPSPRLPVLSTPTPPVISTHPFQGPAISPPRESISVSPAQEPKKDLQTTWTLAHIFVFWSFCIVLWIYLFTSSPIIFEVKDSRD